MGVYRQLAALHISLPPATPPAAAYLPFAISGSLVFLSGHTAKIDGQPWTGRLGDTLTTAQGQAAAHSVAIALMGTLQAAVGDLERIERIVKLVCLVNSTAEYTEHHLVADGASRLLAQVFGEKGRHARSAFGVSQIPRGACLEIELIAALKPDGPAF